MKLSTINISLIFLTLSTCALLVVDQAEYNQLKARDVDATTAQALIHKQQAIMSTQQADLHTCATYLLQLIITPTPSPVTLPEETKLL